MSKKILLVRSTPSALHIDDYNVQQLGIGKSFVQKGFDYDSLLSKRMNPEKTLFFMKIMDAGRDA